MESELVSSLKHRNLLSSVFWWQNGVIPPSTESGAEVQAYCMLTLTSVLFFHPSLQPWEKALERRIPRTNLRGRRQPGSGDLASQGPCSCHFGIQTFNLQRSGWEAGALGPPPESELCEETSSSPVQSQLQKHHVSGNPWHPVVRTLWGTGSVQDWGTKVPQTTRSKKNHVSYTGWEDGKGEGASWKLSAGPSPENGFYHCWVPLGASLIAQTVKNSPANARDLGSIPGSGRFPGKGNGNPVQYSCLENSMGRGAWWVTVHGITKSLSMHKWWVL